MAPVRAHSWVACADYRGGVNFFEQERCVAWPRQYEPVPQPHGYQIADDESRAWGNGGCDRPMASPDWRSAYSAAFPHAIYEQGRVYCLAWPMKNHATTLPGCTNPHAKSDPGSDETISLFVSDLNPGVDPPQAVFNLRNINELAGLAENCSHIWSQFDRELDDKCQLGLEKHRNGEIDCKGFQRSPRFCDDTGRAMGTGCFQIPSDMTPGHYVAQWNWRATFPLRGNFGYTTCFDFEVVARGSPDARPGSPGTTDRADNSPPCQNNMDMFQKEQTSAPTFEPTQAPTPSGDSPTSSPTQTPSLDCVTPYGTCASPASADQSCCTLGYSCVFVNADWAQCLPESQTAEPTPVPSPSTPVPTPRSTCAGPYMTCKGPESPAQCCTAGFMCKFVNSDWAQCLPKSQSEAPTPVPSPATPAPSQGSTCAQPYLTCKAPGIPERCCTAGYACKFVNVEWAQCFPESTPEPTPASRQQCATPYQICTGPGWQGPTCCTTGYRCVAQNAHWFQCIPTSSQSMTSNSLHRRLHLSSDRPIVEVFASGSDPVDVHV
eukprot:TRINITY_DN22318_c0_g1_i1.p1 TRINITY_DN22318_c0_g1~~TRINITY_DN22318_c0_g1_i1.p1  ORF type:complete len:626 (-),score=41.83 TRINITY_DN22318_c0_g1_i1:307-1950(-)